MSEGATRYYIDPATKLPKQEVTYLDVDGAVLVTGTMPIGAAEIDQADYQRRLDQLAIELSTSDLLQPPLNPGAEPVVDPPPE